MRINVCIAYAFVDMSMVPVGFHTTHYKVYVEPLWALIFASALDRFRIYPPSKYLKDFD